MLAPQFTRENAAEMARRSNQSRKERKKREMLAEEKRDIQARALALAFVPDPEERRANRVKKQIDGLLNDMEHERDSAERRKIAASIADLWKLVEPTAGVKKNRVRRPEPPVV